MPDALNVAIGAAVRRRREEMGMSQAALADALELSRTSITNIEIGRQPLSLRHLYLTSLALGVAAHALLPEVAAVTTPARGRRAPGMRSLLGKLDEQVVGSVR